MKHIYWFTYYNKSAPSIRYRAIYALEKLSTDYGVSYDFVHPSYKPSQILNFIKVFFTVLFARKENSVIVFQKIYTRRIYANALKFLLYFRPSNTLYDIDDAEYKNYPPQTINHFMANCSCVSVGSRRLMKYAKQFNSNVHILTSPVIEHDQIKTKRNTLFTIGWIGFYNAHRDNLRELFFPAIKEIDFPIKLVLLGVTKPDHIKEIKDYFAPFSNVMLEIPENIDWQDELSIYQRIKYFDIGVSPLLNTEICRAKSAFKLKQCFSCGVPVLASKLGENAVFLKDGVNGFFCDNPQEYAEKIKLVRDMTDSEYKAMQSDALSSIGSFDMNKFCSSFAKLFTHTNGIKQSSGLHPATETK